MLDISINRESEQAVYQQIASQVRTLINTGKLPAGTQLPPVRTLAQQLGVNRLTVQHAYSELQAGGWVESTVGSGTFVLAPQPLFYRYRTLNCELTPNNLMADLQAQYTAQPMRSLASADPDLSSAPMDEIIGNLRLLRDDNAIMSGYSSAEGDSQLRLEIGRWVKLRGISAVPDTIHITSGATQAIFIAAFALAEPGDTVLIHQPLYIGLIHTLSSLRLNLVPVPSDENGPDIDALQQAIVLHRPKFFLLVSSFSNPTGQTISPERKHLLLDIAQEHNLLLVEDDVYGLLAYDAPPPVPMKALDQNVIYINSFSKILLPGLRIGYIIAPRPYRERLLAARRAIDASGTTVIERALAYYLKSGRLQDYIRRMNSIYARRRDTLLQALRDAMPAGVRWTEPAGGFSCWVTLPQDNMLTIYRACVEMGISFTPGDSFYIDCNPNRHFRLCFGTQSEGEIREIVQLLAQVIEDHIEIAR